MSLLKSERWRSWKIPLMLAMAYFAMLGGAEPPPIEKTLFQIAVFLVAVIGIAGFGHFFTDIFDVEEDRIRGEPNMWASQGAWQRLIVLAGLLAASSLPWLWIPIGKAGLLLVAAEFLMFAAYAVPPVRLKSRGVAGIVADGMYAHALPALWTWLPFAHLSGAETPIWMGAIIGAWGISVGVRDLMHHRAIDAECDRAAGATTYGARRGRSHLMTVLERKVLPVEVATFLVLLGAMSATSFLPLIGFLAYAAWSLVKVRTIWLEAIDLFPRPNSEDGVTVLARRILSPFYYGWLPLLLLVALALRDPAYFVLLLLHLVIFGRMITQLSRGEIFSSVIAIRKLVRPRVLSSPVRNP